MECSRRRGLLRSLCAVAIVCTSGCSEYVRQSAVTAIAQEIQSENSTLAAKLESSGNPTGQGVIVFVRADANCAPRYAWIWLDDRTPSYALDTASQALTPRLATLSNAASATLRRIDSEPEKLRTAVREAVCQVARK
jgi:hypothetical protein